MKKIPLTKGKFALVDDEDFEYLNQWSWYASNRGYAARGQRNVKPGIRAAILMHRVVLNVKEGSFVDHIDGDRLNNQKSNLRLCTISQNSQNRFVGKRTKSGYKGVDLTGNRWRARIMIDKKNIHIGYFGRAIDAARAYNEKAKELFGEFAKLNNI